jgi:malonyl CoA-acyl carrier protein transacylase
MISYMFPGQGSQKKGMGESLFDEFPELTEAADDILGYSIKSLCLSDESNSLGKTEFTQPALYVVNALYFRKQIKDTALTPDFLLGHSLGEYNALHAAGAFSFEDGLKLVQKRGALMSEAPKGAMAAVIGISPDKVLGVLNENGLASIDLANLNSPMQTIISGPDDDIDKAKDMFEAKEATYIRLNTSGAFHSRYMQQAKEKFKAYLQQFTFSELGCPVIANLHGKPYDNSNIVENLSEQISSPVRWVDSVHYLLAAYRDMEFHEIGPGDVLTKLAKQIKAQAPVPMSPKHGFDEQPSHRSKDGAEESGRNNPLQDLEQKIKEWNQRYPIGTRVQVEDYDQELETRTEACVLFGHRAAVYLKGYKGYFALEEVTPL